MPKIEDEISQKGFQNEYQKALVNIMFTASWFTGQMNTLLKPFNISMQQFNLLRILRGAYPEPVSVKLLGARMIDKNSNASRLVEKLRKKELVERTLSAEDRRKVNVIISNEGLKVLAEASKVVDSQLVAQLEILGKDQAILLNQMLDQLRNS